MDAMIRSFLCHTNVQTEREKLCETWKNCVKLKKEKKFQKKLSTFHNFHKFIKLFSTIKFKWHNCLWLPSYYRAETLTSFPLAQVYSTSSASYSKIIYTMKFKFSNTHSGLFLALKKVDSFTFACTFNWIEENNAKTQESIGLIRYEFRYHSIRFTI